MLGMLIGNIKYKLGAKEGRFKYNKSIPWGGGMSYVIVEYIYMVEIIQQYDVLEQIQTQNKISQALFLLVC